MKILEQTSIATGNQREEVKSMRQNESTCKLCQMGIFQKVVNVDGGALQLANIGNSRHDLYRRMKAAPNQKETLGKFIVANPEILGGEPVFRGTRVPVASLFEHLESDCSLDEFLENFPTVTRIAAVSVLMGAQDQSKL